jgi:hypothetical protein
MDRSRLSKLLSWLKKQKPLPTYFRRVHIVSKISAIPEEVGRDIYIVQDSGLKKWAFSIVLARLAID